MIITAVLLLMGLLFAEIAMVFIVVDFNKLYPELRNKTDFILNFLFALTMLLLFSGTIYPIIYILVKEF